jgi:hypothetical protein
VRLFSICTFQNLSNGLKKTQIGHHYYLHYYPKDSKHFKIPTLAQEGENPLGNVGLLILTHYPHEEGEDCECE